MSIKESKILPSAQPPYSLLQSRVIHHLEPQYFLVFFCKFGQTRNGSSCSNRGANIIKFFCPPIQHVFHPFHSQFISSTFRDNEGFWKFLLQISCNFFLVSVCLSGNEQKIHPSPVCIFQREVSLPVILQLLPTDNAQSFNIVFFSNCRCRRDMIRIRSPESDYQRIFHLSSKVCLYIIKHFPILITRNLRMNQILALHGQFHASLQRNIHYGNIYFINLHTTNFGIFI